MNIAQNICELIGNTPMVSLNNLGRDLPGKVAVKMELMNPSGSVKDRIGLALINAAEKEGLIGPKTIIVEPTSGNTGVGLAMVCAVRGYKIKLVMPESMTVERRRILSAYGAELVLTPASEGMAGAVSHAKEMVESESNHFMPQQFENPANPEVHRLTTALEIWNDTDGSVEAFVAGVGTGGTVTGVSEILKQKKPTIYTAAVEPADSAVLSGRSPGPHAIQGIGAGFIPAVLNREILNEIITVENKDAYKTARDLAKKEGIFAGISTGANVWAALQLAACREFEGKLIVTVACDTGERYLSTDLFA